MKIILACAGGYSTSMLVERMKESAKEKGLEIHIDAISTGTIDKIIDDVDIIMLGPQMGHAEEGLREKHKEKNIPITVIDMLDYGMMDGEKVLNQAIDLIKKGE